MALSCSVSETKRNNRYFFHTPMYATTSACEKQFANVFVLFPSLQTQFTHLPADVNKFRKDSSVYAQYTRVTDRQTDGNLKREAFYYVTLTKNDLIFFLQN